MVKESDTVGKEIPKEYREIVTHLVANQGWRYDRTHGKHPMVFPADKSKAGIPVPTSPGDQRGLRNFIAMVKRANGVWPPPSKKGA